MGSPLAPDMATLREKIDAFTHASRGSKKRALLLALDAGFDFTVVVGAMDDEGIKLSYQCILDGLIDRGQITLDGRAWLEKEMS